MLAVGCVEPHQASRWQEEEGRRERVMRSRKEIAGFVLIVRMSIPFLFPATSESALTASNLFLLTFLEE
jgi:hypothetical protein